MSLGDVDIFWIHGGRRVSGRPPLTPRAGVEDCGRPCRGRRADRRVWRGARRGVHRRRGRQSVTLLDDRQLQLHVELVELLLLI